MSFSFEGRSVAARDGDTVASALYRSGVRVFSRSFKYHRPRGLLCLSGDCPNCLVTVDGEVNVRACECAAGGVSSVSRQNGWPSVDHDAGAVFDRMHRLLPVGFYYKTLARPSFVWPLAEPMIRRVAGLGRASRDDVPRDLERAHRHPDVLVIGAGPAGLAAALAAAEQRRRVLIVDEQEPGARVAPGPTRDVIDRLLGELRGRPEVELLRASATGIYEGPTAVVVADDLVHMVHPRSIVLACGGLETFRVFPGNDLPGVFLARGAARLAGVHDVAPGRNAVVWAETPEAVEHARVLATSGVFVQAVVAAPGLDVGDLPVPVIRDASVVAARGRRALRGVVVESPRGRQEIACDVLAVGSELQPNEHLVRLAYDQPVVLAGDCAGPMGSLEEAVASGDAAGRSAVGGVAPFALPPNPRPRSCGTDGYICICEDVTVADCVQAVGEGFDSAELLKRYTTVTMGPCQGRLCADQLRAVAERTTPAEAERVGVPTTLRPPVRPLRLEEAAAGMRHHLERRTALHERHRAAGASFLWAGPWKRVEAYRGDVEGEYRAVREGVGLIDVGTLGKFLLAGPDAVAFLERLYPMRVADLEPGRLRYGLLLEENGVIIDDGTVCALEGGRFYLTVTTTGAERLESLLLDWRDAWDLEVYALNQTASLGAVNLAGPRARQVLERVCDDPVDRESFPYLRHREITVAGIPCRALRLGFVGELGYELHHPSSRSVELWDALLDAGAPFGIRPFGLEAQRLLRLEKGHIIVSQDTDFETTPWKIGMGWAVKLDKEDFVGRRALLRSRERPDRELLVPFTLPAGTPAPPEGSTVVVDGRLAGRVTSSRRSPVLGHPVGLAWVSREHAEPGSTVTVAGATATVGKGAFYDPEGVKLRA